MYSSLIALIILIFLSGYFSATETAFSSLNIIKIKNLAAQGNKKAALVLELCEKYDKLLSSILVGNNIVNILSASLATLLFVGLAGDKGVFLSTVVMTVVVLIFGEVFPKSLAKEMPETFALFSSPYINLICKILTPITLFFVFIKQLLSKLFGIKRKNTLTDDEILTIVKEAQADGVIDADEGNLIKSAIEFYDLEAYDILIPRVDITAVEKDTPIEKINELFRESGFSRIPVYEDTIDNIIGMINQKDFYYSVADGKKTVAEAITPVTFVSGDMKISDLLTLLQRKKTHLAVVTDEYGGTEGIVTLEDIIEELVGEIWDEHDKVKVEVTRLANDCYKLSSNASLDRLEELFDIKIESENTTVGGWVSEVLEKIPAEKDSFEYKGIAVTVTKADKRRALEVVAARKE